MTTRSNNSRGCLKTPGLGKTSFTFDLWRILMNRADGLDGRKMSFHTGSRRSQPPLAALVPPSRFTSRVGGGSAFYVRRLALCAFIISLLSPQSGFCSVGVKLNPQAHPQMHCPYLTQSHHARAWSISPFGAYPLMTLPLHGLPLCRRRTHRGVRVGSLVSGRTPCTMLRGLRGYTFSPGQIATIALRLRRETMPMAAWIMSG